MEPYYYSQMNKQQQGVYRQMREGLMSLTSSFPAERLDGRELGDIFFKLRLDNPEIFYAVGFKYRFYKDSPNVEILPEYLFDKGKVKEHQKAMKARVEKLVRPAKGMNEVEKEQYIHDFICRNVRYDKLKKPYSHEIIGPLGQGVGVCEGIAKSVKILCDVLGIPCIIAVSDANPEKNIKYRHAWNVLKIHGKYYHLDATFDNSLGHTMEQDIGKTESLRYDYFNLNDKQLFRDHEPVMYPVPACEDGEHFYYKEKKMSFTKLEDIEKRGIQAVRKKKSLTFHWRGGYLTREVLDEILEVLGKTAIQKNVYARIGLNWPQAVMCVSFQERPSEEGVVMEEANEGEQTNSSSS